MSRTSVAGATHLPPRPGVDLTKHGRRRPGPLVLTHGSPRAAVARGTAILPRTPRRVRAITPRGDPHAAELPARPMLHPGQVLIFPTPPQRRGVISIQTFLLSFRAPPPTRERSPANPWAAVRLDPVGEGAGDQLLPVVDGRQAWFEIAPESPLPRGTVCTGTLRGAAGTVPFRGMVVSARRDDLGWRIRLVLAPDPWEGRAPVACVS